MQQAQKCEKSDIDVVDYWLAVIFWGEIGCMSH